VSDISKKPAPSYAPVYAAACYPDLAEVFRSHGYALTVHGSLQRDFDLIAIPWVENQSPPKEVVDAILSAFAAKVIGDASIKPHGRLVYTLSMGYGHFAIDLGFIGLAPVPSAEAVQAAVEAMRSACATCSPYAAEQLVNAIAGLTGEGE